MQPWDIHSRGSKTKGKTEVGERQSRGLREGGHRGKSTCRHTHMHTRTSPHRADTRMNTPCTQMYIHACSRHSGLLAGCRQNRKQQISQV